MLPAPVSFAPAWVATMGSLSTYATRTSGAISAATSWVLGEVGMPVPMSTICRIPAPTTVRTARRRKARLARTLTRASGASSTTRSAAWRSTS